MHQLYGKIKKCEFHLGEVVLLRHLVSKQGIKVNPQKVKAITQWPKPTYFTKIRSFMGLVGYYRRFMKHFSRIASPFSHVLKKATKFEGIEKREHEELRQRLTTTLILTLPVEGKDFTVYNNASKNGLGYVLTQDDKVVAYDPNSLSPTRKITLPMI